MSLGVNQLIGFGVGGEEPLVAEYLGSIALPAADPANHGIWTAPADGHLFLGLVGASPSNTRRLTGVTFGGVAADSWRATGGAGIYYQAAFAMKRVTAGDYQIISDWEGTIATAAFVWFVTGIQTNLIPASGDAHQNNTSATSMELTIDTWRDGLALGVCMHGNASDIGWSTMTEVDQITFDTSRTAAAAQKTNTAMAVGATETCTFASSAAAMHVLTLPREEIVEYDQIDSQITATDALASAGRTFTGLAAIKSNYRALIGTCVVVTPTTTPISVSSCTIGGVQCEKIASTSSQLVSGERLLEFWLAPEGATGDVIHTVNQATTEAGVVLWELKGIRSSTPTATYTDDTRVLTASNVLVPEGGAVFGLAVTNDTGAITWVGNDEDADATMQVRRRGAASQFWYVDETSIATMTATGGTSNNTAFDTMLVISLR